MVQAEIKIIMIIIITITIIIIMVISWRVARSCLGPVQNGEIRRLLPSTSLRVHLGQVIGPSSPPT